MLKVKVSLRMLSLLESVTGRYRFWAAVLVWIYLLHLGSIHTVNKDAKGVVQRRCGEEPPGERQSGCSVPHPLFGKAFSYIQYGLEPDLPHNHQPNGIFSFMNADFCIKMRSPD